MNLENLDLEKAVLAAMITDVQVFFALTDRLQVEAFTSTLHRALYREIGKMANHDGRVSHKLLTHRLQSEFEDIGPYVGALVSMGKDSDEIAMAQDYAESLVDMHMRRAAQSAIEETRKALAQIDHPPETALIKLTESLADLTNLADFGRMQTLSQAIGTVVDQIGDISSGQASGIGWPLAGLHELAGEAMPGDLILLGGAPGAGKTALAMQCATAIAQSRSVAFFEMEMAHSELVKRWYAGAVGVPSNAIKRDMDSKQFNILAENAPGYRDFRMQIWDEKFSVPQMRARSMAQMKRMGLDMIVVDHADLILKESKYRLRGFEKTHDNVEDLKQMAKDLGCVVLVLCHFTKSAREKDTPEPTMEDFSGGGIEKHADIMLATLNRHTWLMTNPPRIKSEKAQDKYQTELLEHEGRIEIHRLKHRRKHMRGVKVFNWDGSRTLLTDIVPAQRDLLDEKPPF